MRLLTQSSKLLRHVNNISNNSQKTNANLALPHYGLREPLAEVPVHDGDEDLVERVVLERVQRDQQRVPRQPRRDQVGAAAGGQHGRHEQL